MGDAVATHCLQFQTISKGTRTVGDTGVLPELLEFSYELGILVVNLKRLEVMHTGFLKSQCMFRADSTGSQKSTAHLQVPR